MLLLTNIGQLLTLRGEAAPRRGRDLGEPGIVEDGAVLAAGSKIVGCGPRREVTRAARGRRVREIDCGGRVVLPGFVDGHTHPAFAGPRLVDFEQRIAGATYEQIAERGGGIRSSIAGVRSATRSSLTQQVSAAFARMVAHGTTTLEAKSGYGLDSKSELKSLEAIRAASAEFSGTVIATLLGAHVVPAEFSARREAYVRLVCDEMIPAVAKKKLAEFVDVFCERGAFTLAETEQIFRAARAHGLGLRAHVCQLSQVEVAGLLRFGPASLDHMECVRKSELPLLARSNTVATLLPGANYFLGHECYAPARRMIEAGVAIALATDFNPGTSPTLSMPMVLSLACTQMRMSAAEAITAATINGAAAVRLVERKGSIEPGKDADLAIFDVRDYREIPYWFGENRCWAVVAKGRFRGAGVSFRTK